MPMKQPIHLHNPLQRNDGPSTTTSTAAPQPRLSKILDDPLTAAGMHSNAPPPRRAPYTRQSAQVPSTTPHHQPRQSNQRLPSPHRWTAVNPTPPKLPTASNPIGIATPSTHNGRSHTRTAINPSRAPATANTSHLADTFTDLDAFEIFPRTFGPKPNTPRTHQVGYQPPGAYHGRHGHHMPQQTHGSRHPLDPTSNARPAGTTSKGVPFPQSSKQNTRANCSNSQSPPRNRRTPSPPFPRLASIFPRLIALPSGRRRAVAITLILISVLGPVFFVCFVDLNETLTEPPTAGLPRTMKASHIVSPRSQMPSRQLQSQALWVNHVVIGNDQLLLAETFESRLNAEVAPVLQRRVSQIWDRHTSPELHCQSGEKQLVAFSIAKSASLPGSISVLRPCSESARTRLCHHKRYIADVRDLVITLPSHSSRYTYSVQIVEDRGSFQTNDDEMRPPRRVKPLGTVSGPFQVELSDVSRLALQRYCGTTRRNFASDLITEPITLENTRLLPLFELKRLFGLLKVGTNTDSDGSQISWDSLQLSKATINPIDHSPHSLTLSHLHHLFGSGVNSNVGEFGQADGVTRHEGSVPDSNSETEEGRRTSPDGHEDNRRFRDEAEGREQRNSREFSRYSTRQRVPPPSSDRDDGRYSGPYSNYDRDEWSDRRYRRFEEGRSHYDNYPPHRRKDRDDYSAELGEGSTSSRKRDPERWREDDVKGSKKTEARKEKAFEPHSQGTPTTDVKMSVTSTMNSNSTSTPDTSASTPPTNSEISQAPENNNNSEAFAQTSTTSANTSTQSTIAPSTNATLAKTTPPSVTTTAETLFRENDASHLRQIPRIPTPIGGQAVINNMGPPPPPPPPGIQPNAPLPAAMPPGLNGQPAPFVGGPVPMQPPSTMSGLAGPLQPNPGTALLQTQPQAPIGGERLPAPPAAFGGANGGVGGDRGGVGGSSSGGRMFARAFPTGQMYAGGTASGGMMLPPRIDAGMARGGLSAGGMMTGMAMESGGMQPVTPQQQGVGGGGGVRGGDGMAMGGGGSGGVRGGDGGGGFIQEQQPQPQQQPQQPQLSQRHQQQSGGGIGGGGGMGSTNSMTPPTMMDARNGMGMTSAIQPAIGTSIGTPPISTNTMNPLMAQTTTATPNSAGGGGSGRAGIPRGALPPSTIGGNGMQPPLMQPQPLHPTTPHTMRLQIPHETITWSNFRHPREGGIIAQHYGRRRT